MKNSINILSLCVAGLFLCSFQTPSTSIDIQEIFQEAFFTEELSDVFEKDSDGQLLPLTLVTNQLIAEDLDLKYDGKAINISTAKEYATTVLELTGVKIKAKKSILEFKYQNKTIKIRLKKDDNQWRAFSILIKSKGNFDLTTVSRKEF